MTMDNYTACAEQLASTPELVARLLAGHTPNPQGWCRQHDAHPERHPCSIRTLAELAAVHVQAAGAPDRRARPRSRREQLP